MNLFYVQSGTLLEKGIYKPATPSILQHSLYYIECCKVGSNASFNFVQAKSVPHNTPGMSCCTYLLNCYLMCILPIILMFDRTVCNFFSNSLVRFPPSVELKYATKKYQFMIDYLFFIQKKSSFKVKFVCMQKNSSTHSFKLLPHLNINWFQTKKSSEQLHYHIFQKNKVWTHTSIFFISQSFY